MSFKKNAKNGTAYKIGISFLISAATLSAISLLSAVIAYCTHDPLSLIKPLSIAAIIISAAVSAFITTKIYSITNAILSSLMLTLIMLTAGIIAVGGIRPSAMLNYACYMATAALFSYFASRKPKRRHRHAR